MKQLQRMTVYNFLKKRRVIIFNIIFFHHICIGEAARLLSAIVKHRAKSQAILSSRVNLRTLKKDDLCNILQNGKDTVRHRLAAYQAFLHNLLYHIPFQVSSGAYRKIRACCQQQHWPAYA
jgi:hypothetical protein